MTTFNDSNVTDSLKTLEDFVRRFRVCYEVWPEYRIVKGLRRQIGLALELSGTHEPGMGHPGAGCIHCRTIFKALHEIGERILPPPDRSSRYEMDPYDQAIHRAHVRGDRTDVCLTIRVYHREGFEKPLDECQTRCLSDMVQRLEALGAGKVRWRGGEGKAR